MFIILMNVFLLKENLFSEDFKNISSYELSETVALWNLLGIILEVLGLFIFLSIKF